MKTGNKLTWEILSQEEKTALTLSINYGKSTWQAGEIMNKAHYKYLEIQARATQFFKMYNEYFVATGNKRIPDGCVMDVYFRDFIIYTVFERKTPKEAISLLGNNPLVVAAARERIFREQLQNLANSDNEKYRMLYDLIYEYDRWNNIRILPPSLQEPSAYKRRNKARLIKHLKNLSSLDPYYIHRFVNRFQVKPGRKALFIAVLSKDKEEGYDIIRIVKKKSVVDYISKHLRLYIFKEDVDADQFGFLVNKYLKNENKDCKDGQKFWPLYRKIIETAYNYNDVNNIIPRRKHIEKAFRDLDEINIRKQAKKSRDINGAMNRADSDKFWVI